MYLLTHILNKRFLQYARSSNHRATCKGKNSVLKAHNGNQLCIGKITTTQPTVVYSELIKIM